MDSDEATARRLGLLLVWWLAALAGAVDASGYFLLKGLFVSFMSGNTTMFGIALAHMDVARSLTIAGVILAFVFGATTGSVTTVLAGRRHLAVIVFCVAVLLMVPPLVPVAAVPALAFAMGLLSAAMQHAGQVKVSVTYVTGTLVKLGQGLGLYLCGRARDWTWLEQAVPWTGLLAGAIAATASLGWYGGRSLIYLPFLALLVAFVAWNAPREVG